MSTLVVPSQAITPEKLEVMKVQIAENLEEPFRERFGKLEEELEHYRSEYNKLRYEHSFLKSEYEHETAEHKRIMEEMKLQYETEVSVYPAFISKSSYFQCYRDGFIVLQFHTCKHENLLST